MAIACLAIGLSDNGKKFWAYAEDNGFVFLLLLSIDFAAIFCCLLPVTLPHVQNPFPPRLHNLNFHLCCPLRSRSHRYIFGELQI